MDWMQIIERAKQGMGDFDDTAASLATELNSEGFASDLSEAIGQAWAWSEGTPESDQRFANLLAAICADDEAGVKAWASKITHEIGVLVDMSDDPVIDELYTGIVGEYQKLPH